MRYIQGDEEEEETDDLVNQVLAEIGLAAAEGVCTKDDAECSFTITLYNHC